MSQAMKICATIFLILGMATIGLGKIGLREDNNQPTINVLDFGATGDGKTDDTQAFLKAWKQACGTKADHVNLIIEKDKIFLLKVVRLEGPCQSPSIHVQISGKIIAPSSKNEWGDVSSGCWLVFYQIEGLTVDGEGTFDGQGSIWWQQGSKNHIFHPLDAPLNKGPDALTFTDCNNLTLKHLNFVNPPRRHVVIYNSKGATITNLNLLAPDASPNTDGIGIAASSDVQLHDCTIQTGDDCIAIGPSSYRFNISNINCGPGHGISVGSLGQNGALDKVEDVEVRNCTFSGTQNGVRIKTWQGGVGFAKRISFGGIILKDVSNPIIIDQYYCPHQTCTNEDDSAVKVSEVSFSQVHGTTISEKPITLNCSETLACTNIILKNINITSADRTRNVSSECQNAHGQVENSFPPVDCLQN